ncbi:hypothetical protein H9L10_13290 [Phycicoccus endophyticus]|uniref:Uncharacterized protein n=1 Tax=Phycicoccus endophyticus TaxID=1690220 RepID=A0A7G9R0R0_9MICO|nr:hypothetical protein [Phycicoccus endophyticus]NHI19472.1 hypothetical protein [Phycicoccus endophyticus]QNN49185.1 hypothetical protein H9L10_13290 [Phycicoccus endophyticus]GGL39442.1 hypothetical protein GCM10012283_22430 [Phycicoccus endophyticus]
MDTTPRSPTRHHHGLRALGGLGSAAAVALVGVAALPASTAAAAGVADDRPQVRTASADPAALPTETSTRSVTWRWDGTRWVRLEG